MKARSDGEYQPPSARVTRRYFLRLAGVIGLGTAVAAVSYPSVYAEQTIPESFLIDIPYHAQEVAGLYCGPASLQMILDYLNPQQVPSQDQLANEMGTNVQRYTSFSEMANALIMRGYVRIFTKSNLTIDDLKEYISYDIPSIAAVLSFNPRYAGEGHYVVVNGYDDNSQEIIFNDPGIGGPNCHKSYQTFVDHWNAPHNPPETALFVPYKGQTYIPIPT